MTGGRKWAALERAMAQAVLQRLLTRQGVAQSIGLPLPLHLSDIATAHKMVELLLFAAAVPSHLMNS